MEYKNGEIAEFLKNIKTDQKQKVNIIKLHIIPTFYILCKYYYYYYYHLLL